MSARYVETRTTSVTLPPAFSQTAWMFRHTWRACSSASPGPISRSSSSRATCPAMKSVVPTFQPCEYGHGSGCSPSPDSIFSFFTTVSTDMRRSFLGWVSRAGCVPRGHRQRRLDVVDDGADGARDLLEELLAELGARAARIAPDAVRQRAERRPGTRLEVREDRRH